MERLTFTKEQRIAEGVTYAKYFCPELCEMIDKKLSEYEDAEERGRVFITPDIPERCEMFLIYDNGPIDEPKPKIKALDFNNRWSISNGLLIGHLYRNGFNASFTLKELGKTVFLTREEAEQALKGGNHE